MKTLFINQKKTFDMTSLDCSKRRRRMDHLIRQKATGQPSDFAKRLGVSRATLYRNITELKNEGAHIQYSKEDQTFFYEEPFVFVFE